MDAVLRVSEQTSLIWRDKWISGKRDAARQKRDFSNQRKKWIDGKRVVARRRRTAQQAANERIRELTTALTETEKKLQQSNAGTNERIRELTTALTETEQKLYQSNRSKARLLELIHKTLVETTKKIASKRCSECMSWIMCQVCGCEWDPEDDNVCPRCTGKLLLDTP